MNRLFRLRSRRRLHTTRRWELESEWITRGVLEENIKYQSDQQTGILLWDQWLALLRDASHLGSVLISSRNSHAILGEFGVFPELIAGPDEGSAMDAGRSLLFDFASWYQAMAWSECRAHGRLYKIEVVDASAQPFFRLSLTQDSDRDRFLELVQTHQSWGLQWEASRALQPMPGDASCIPSSAAGWTHSLEPGEFWNMLDELCFARASVEIHASSAGASQSVRFPVCAVQEMQEWLFLSGTHACAHLRLNDLAALRWSGPPSEMNGIWQVQGLLPDGRVAFSLSGNHFLPSFE